MMRLFTEIVSESKREWNLVSQQDLKDFATKIRGNKSVSKEFMKFLQYCIELNLIDGEILEDRVINGGTSDFKWMSDHFGGDPGIYAEMNRIAKKIKPELRGLPQFMSTEDWNQVMTGKRDISDITLDLETEKGKERCIKMYSPLVTAIVVKYKSSGLDWDSLISAGYLGLTKAINDYHKPDEYVDIETDNPNKAETKKAKGLSFKQYAGYRIRQQILSDLNDYSRTVRISQYQYEKNKKEGNTAGNFNTVSIDTTIDDEGNTLVDRMAELANDNTAFRGSADHKWDKIYKAINDKFSTKVATTFYKFFGLNGYKQMRGVEIAKELHVTGAAVSLNVKAVMNFLKNDKNTRDILADLLSLYTESLINNNPVETISEVMITDDVLIMLKESTQWYDPKVFNNAMGAALENFQEDHREFLIKCLEEGIDFVDANYDKNRSRIISFLENVYPTECIRRKGDVEIINMMSELNENFKIHNA